MNKFNFISAAILLAVASVAHAAESTTALPGDKGLASVNKNLEKNPDNKGLQNASGKLEQNRLKHAEQAEKRNEKHEKHMEKKAERVESRAERREAMGRPAKVERPGK